MQVLKHSKLFSLLFLSLITMGSFDLRADDADVSTAPNESWLSEEEIELQKRGFLSVSSAVGANCDSLTVELLTPAALGNTTTNLCRCKLYKMVKSSYYSPASVNGCPMLRATASGATLDLCHTCLTFCRSDCTTHCIGIEVGYSPQARQDDTSLVQPNTVTIQNGIMSKWDVGILVHSGVRNIVLKNMVFTDNVIPIMLMGENNENGIVEDPVCSVILENVSIIGGCSEYRACLDWIRAFLSDGTLESGATITETPLGYVNGEAPPCVCDPIADTLHGSFVYTGLYTHGATDIRLKNVHVSGIGFADNIVDAPEEGEDPPVPAVLAERTSAYGMWFRNSRSIFMEDVASVKNKSSLAAVGVMFDESALISVKNANFASNTIMQQQPAHANPTCCREGLWAAGVAIKDSHTASFCDMVVSENRGIDNVWGVRSILSAVFDNATPDTTPGTGIRPTIDLYSPTVNTLTFENTYADELRADRVYGFDFGDIYRKALIRIERSVLGTPTAFLNVEPLPAGAVQKLSMKNTTVCAAKGKVIGTAAEEEVAEEFKGIYLGDGSSGICLDGVRIGANAVVLDPLCQSQVGVNSGIEFGAPSTLYTLTVGPEVDDDLVDLNAKMVDATGLAKGTIADLVMNDVKISNNTGGSDEFRFVGIRATATGTNSVHGAGINKFSDITLTNAHINANQFDGFRAVDDAPGDVQTPVVVSGLTVENATFNSSIDGYGMNFETLSAATLKNIDLDLNNVRGFFAQNISCVDIFNISICDTADNPDNLCGAVITEVYGFDAIGDVKSLRIEGGRFNGTNATDAHVAGFHIDGGESITLKDVQSDCNVSRADAGQGPYTTRGFYFETSIDNLSLTNVDANNNCALNGNVFGIQVDRATSVHANNVRANNNKAEGEQSTNGNVSTAVGMFFKATVGSKTSEGCLMKNLQACGNTNAHLAYGIYMQEPIGLVINGIDGSSNVSNVSRDLLDGNLANSLLPPMLSQAIGIYFEGGSSVHMTDVHASANHQTETVGPYLSRHLEGGFVNPNLITSSADSEWHKNISDEIAHHFPVANRSGAYGIFAEGTQDISIDRGSACNNSGVRAFGVHARGVDNFCIHHFDALDNYGIGDPFASIHHNIDVNSPNPFNLQAPNTLDPVVQNPGADGINPEMDPNNVDVADAQAECKFGGIDPATKVDLKQAYQELLKAFNKHANNGMVNDPCAGSDPCDSTATTDNCVPALANLIWATLAPCRRFCTGAGIGMYNSNYAMIEDSRAMGNWSLCDSGGGFVFYGKGEGHSVVRCVAANNECYKASERGGMGTFHIDGNVDISKWQQFYTFLDVGLLNSETVLVGAQNDTYGFDSLPSVVIKADHIDGATRKPTSLVQPEGNTTDNWTLIDRRMTVGIVPTGTAAAEYRVDLYNFVGVGPIGVGILLECQRDSNVADNNCYANKGHSSLGFGILSDAASASMFIDNKTTNNSADALGYAWGMADFAMSSPNVWYKNWMYANRVDTFMNSSYLIVFDNSLSAGQSLPVKEIYPGSIEVLVNSLPLENIVIRFIDERQEFDCVGNLVTDKWISSDTLSCGL